ncbi:anaerobic ribonucleoside triphosphate reductase [Salipaludibacillus sp. CUR1]|uniref:anaerobic ribonucleoside triphosphate reductase n=1 Tax=Salipaludibacillus sp. CUR1 TaxID=2820003 RepID=UPI001E4A345B|nr:anaerobic ribonucleoside triphosphate reductase [Salipaludibacillus sp. CUR1]MCE7791988.1 anaerobic ribonucleoside triphosphate reductase [Salipaludibacillus sp. CUR1]
MRELIDELQGIEQANSEALQENANVDGLSPLGKMNHFASAASRWYTDTFLLSPAVKKAQDDNILYIHDKDFYPTGTTTCSQIPLDKLLRNGFYTGHGWIRPPKSILTAMALTSIIVQSNQNNQHGGQSYQKFDYDLAPYVRRSYENIEKTLINSHRSSFQNFNQLSDYAWELTRKETFQACEAFIHNSNSMHSRGGGQVPFVSINYGTDTSPEGRLLTVELLRATRKGLGNGETPIFPIQIFKVKDGINGTEEDPNYDLFLQAVQTTSRRLFPNFSFLDAPFNSCYLNGTPESEVAYMGCRTRVMANKHGEETSLGRGNLSFSTINLVRIALLAEKKQNIFWVKLQEAVNVAIIQLVERYNYQRNKKANEFPFLYSQGVWRGGEELNSVEKVEEVIKQGTLSVGFIGLAETLTLLTGNHHGESEKAWKLGQKIISRMKEQIDREAKSRNMNFGVIATPAEGLSGKFVYRDREDYGSIIGVTDKEYYTNSFHVPVGFPVSIYEKIKVEAPFHELCEAGHITYAEVDGKAAANHKALIQIINLMKQSGIGYGSINHPVDECLQCGFQGEIQNSCPACGETDKNKLRIIRRITGYLVGDMKKWNNAKRHEESDRVRHSL